MAHDLDVLPVLRDPERPQYRDVHENLLSPPFRLAMVGASKSGKTNLLINYLRKNYYGGCKKSGVKPCFTKIVVFSPNLGMDSTSRCLKDLCDESDIHMTYSDGIVNALIDYQKRQNSDDRDRVLIIADDLLAMGCSPSSVIFQSFSYMRHVDISCLMLTQVYKGQYSMPPVVRNNIDGLVMFRSPSHKQIESLTEDLQGTFGTKKNVQNLLFYATQKPYNFCFFNYRDLEVYHNHTNFLWQKYDENGNYAPDFVKPPSVDDIDEDEDE